MEKKTVREYTKQQTAEYAKQIIKAHYGCDASEIKYVGGGSFGYVYKAGLPVSPHKIIVKACRVSGMHSSEATALRKLAENTLIHIPEVYFTFDATDNIPMDFIFEEYITGTDCFTDFSKLFCSKKKKKAFAENIVEALHNWHSITNDKFGDLEEPEYDNWLDFYKPFAEDILKTALQMHKNGQINNKTVKIMKIAYTHFDEIFSESIERASLIHGDLNVMNVMSDKSLNITAIIDPLDCRWADRDFDLFQLRNLTGEFFGLYDAYKNKYPVSEKCDLKCAFYAVYHEIYCYISSGTHTEIILKTAVRRLEKELKKSGLI